MCRAQGGVGVLRPVAGTWSQGRTYTCGGSCARTCVGVRRLSAVTAQGVAFASATHPPGIRTGDVSLLDHSNVLIAEAVPVSCPSVGRAEYGSYRSREAAQSP